MQDSQYATFHFMDKNHFGVLNSIPSTVTLQPIIIYEAFLYYPHNKAYLFSNYKSFINFVYLLDTTRPKKL